jgi:hypothetical protein
MQMKSTLLVATLLAAAGVVHAQAPPAPATPMAETAPPAPPRSSECEPTKPGMNAQQGATVGQSNEALGDKLARSNGVLCPPLGVDPEIRAPTPETGDRPVIPPPGSPGGNPNVDPK